MGFCLPLSSAGVKAGQLPAFLFLNYIIMIILKLIPLFLFAILAIFLVSSGLDGKRKFWIYLLLSYLSMFLDIIYGSIFL